MQANNGGFKKKFKIRVETSFIYKIILLQKNEFRKH